MNSTITEDDQKNLDKTQKMLMSKVDNLDHIMSRSHHSSDESHARTMQAYLISLEQIIKIKILTQNKND